ncbi:DUF1216 domain-containing protein [Bacillus aquiflavi]|uniref:DUF1216 domain-containing protein n=1 Tax=Bacillus aquiflavi TaxID=2672567 RepID=UPI001CA9D562|nr:DUF1216 domain-containing protein [Bacillus aquiflavi]UAC48777.1 DUF1216 domain-containing protein [Bacillus aquiflavi]
MGNSSKFMKGIMLGAIVGGMLSLLDKNTRQCVFQNCRERKDKIVHLMKNPNIVVEQVKETTGKMKTTFEQVNEDVTFITEKVKEVTPQVVEIVQETKETFSSEKSKIDE